jgi:hypothetical protein
MSHNLEELHIMAKNRKIGKTDTTEPKIDTTKPEVGATKPKVGAIKPEVGAAETEEVSAAGPTQQTSAETDTTEPAGGPDPFDLDSLRLDPAFEETAGVRKVLSTVPVRKPNKQEWISVHPDLAYRGNFSCIKLEEEGNEFYLLTPAIARDFEQEVIPVTIYTLHQQRRCRAAVALQDSFSRRSADCLALFGS